MKKLLYFFPVVLLAYACKKDPPPPEPEPPCMENGLPCLTTEGKNMFACLVDRTPWVAETPVSIGGPVPLYGEYFSSDGWLYLKATLKNENTFQTINIFGDGILTLGEHPMFVQGNLQEGFIDYMESEPCNDYRHKTHDIGVLNLVHLDTINRIISGKFKMNLYDSDCSDSTLVINEGRFDYKY